MRENLKGIEEFGVQHQLIILKRIENEITLYNDGLCRTGILL